MRKISTICVALIAGLIAALPANAISPEDEAALAAFAKPGSVLIMRHAITIRKPDRFDFTLLDCETQRLLSPQGQLQSKEIGNLIKDRGIQVDQVLYSRYCRCEDTARRLDVSDNVKRLKALLSVNKSDEAKIAKKTAELRAFLKTRDRTKKLVMVTHSKNIEALTGVIVYEGGGVVFDNTTDGVVTVLGELKPLEVPKPTEE